MWGTHPRLEESAYETNTDGRRAVTRRGLRLAHRPGLRPDRSREGGSLQLENHSDRRTFYFIHEREDAALIDWAQCVDLDPSVCASLVPGERTAVPYSAIGGYEPGKTEAIVWSWQAVPAPGRHPIPLRLTPR
jgi:hypothetical protein